MFFLQRDLGQFLKSWLGTIYEFLKVTCLEHIVEILDLWNVKCLNSQANVFEIVLDLLRLDGDYSTNHHFKIIQIYIRILSHMTLVVWFLFIQSETALNMKCIKIGTIWTKD